jgi:hypothetical protein
MLTSKAATEPAIDVIGAAVACIAVMTLSPLRPIDFVDSTPLFDND